MVLNIRPNCRYAIACPTSMGVRITPDNRMAVHNSHHFYMQTTSAESNVLNVSSSLGHECLVLTKFVKGSPRSSYFAKKLNAFCNHRIDRYYLHKKIKPDRRQCNDRERKTKEFD